MSILSYRRVLPRAFPLTRGTEFAAGLDIRCMDEIFIPPNGFVQINSGLSVELPVGSYGRICERSSMSVRQTVVLGGIIDQDYRGCLFIMLRNLSKNSAFFSAGSAVAQLIVQPYLPVSVREVQVLSTTTRGVGGFGSTGQ